MYPAETPTDARIRPSPPMTSPSQELAVRAMQSDSRILVPIDGTPSSHRAVQVAGSLAQIRGAELIVLNVVPFPAQMYGPPSETYLDHLFDELQKIKPNKPNIRVRHILREGVPALSILQVAKEWKCDLIVMETHGRTGLNRLLNGSVTEELIRKACCPVLTFKSGDQCDLFDAPHADCRAAVC
jgi:nucleotide-binding universal stress UspA family protein